MNINRVSKAYIFKAIEESGCKMLKDKVGGDDTKEEIIEYLKDCKCPKIHKLFTGIE